MMGWLCSACEAVNNFEALHLTSKLIVVAKRGAFVRDPVVHAPIVWHIPVSACR